MSRLAIILGGFIFIALGIVVLFSDWQAALVLLAIGGALLVFFFRG
jgi:hypothetical protein